MNIDKKYVTWALSYAVLGMCFGIYMSATHDFAQRPTHVHILLVGCVVSFVYAVIHKLWLTQAIAKLANVQFFVHQIGAIAMFSGLFLLFSNTYPEATLAPVLGLSSIVVLSGVLMMIVMLVKSGTATK